MLWYDNDPRTALAAKVARAADYYHKKYGLVADLCLVHPSMLAGIKPDGGGEQPGCPPEAQAGKVHVGTNRYIRPGHLWIGTEEKN
jgi:hypothetical protein